MVIKRKRRTFKERTGCSKKLLIPGYSGELTPQEYKVLLAELKRSAKLRQKWGFVEGEKIIKSKIEKIAMQGCQEDE